MTLKTLERGKRSLPDTRKSVRLGGVKSGFLKFLIIHKNVISELDF